MIIMIDMIHSKEDGAGVDDLIIIDCTTYIIIIGNPS